MCQKCVENIGNTELTYKPPINTEDEESDSNEEEEMNNWHRHSFRLNIISTSLSPIRKKHPTSSMGVMKQSITVNKESNKIRKGSGATSKKDNKKKMQNSIQHQVRQMKFLLQMVN